MTGALLLEGTRLLLPPQVCATTLAPPPTGGCPPAAFQPTAQHQELARAFHRYTNVSLEASFVGQRARPGLSPDPPTTRS